MTRSDEPNPAPARRRKWKWLGALLALMVVILLVAPFLAAPFVKSKLQRMVSDHLHAQLNIGSLGYSFPYSVTVNDASFVAEDTHGPGGANVELLKVKRLRISLAELPFRGGPVVIENLAIDEPTVHMIRRADKTYVGADLAKKGSDAPSGKRKLKLSDALRLRHFELNNATIIYEDRTRPDARPLEWRDIGARLELAQQSPSSYRFTFAAQNEPLAQLNLTGTADVDSLSMAIEQLAMNVKVDRDPGASSPLPPQVQEMLRKLGVEGALRFDARGDLPLMHPMQGTFIFNAALDRVQMRPPSQRWALDQLSLNLEARKGDVPSTRPATGAATAPTSQPADNDVHLKLSRVDAKGVGAKLELSEATGSIDLAGQTWKLDNVTGRVRTIDGAATQPSTSPTTSPTTSPAARPVSIDRWFLDGDVEFSASAVGVFAERIARAASATTQAASTQPSAPDDVTNTPATRPFSPIRSGQLVMTFNNLVLQPPDFPQPIEKVSGAIRMVDRAVLIDDFTATYGADQFLLKHALMPLEDVATRIDIVDIGGEMFFGAPHAPYPEQLEKLLRAMRPAGAFGFSGAASVYVGRGKPEPDYAIRITPRASSLTLTDNDLVVANLQGQVNLVPKLIDVPYLEGEMFGGSVALRGTLTPREPMAYDAQLSVQNADLSVLSTQLKLLRDDGKPKITGRGMARVRGSGEIPAGHLDAAAMRDAILSNIKARGMARIDEGDLWSIKILDGILGFIPVARDALTAGEAAAVFEIHDGKMHLKKAAISSTALGVQGTGDVSLRDQSLNLDIVVAPLGDWRKRIRDTEIPIFSKVAGEVVGALQKVVNTATSQLLYEFHVKGKLTDPKVSAVPAPLLTEGAADLFGLMLRGGRSEKLTEAIGGNEADPGAVAPPK